MRITGAVLVTTVFLGGCTSVRLVQREGCWVRRTERWMGSVKEELGPCERVASPWAQDRLTRVVQECVAQADYRWQTRAAAAFSRGEPLPPELSEKTVLADCVSESMRGVVAENEALKERVAEASSRVAEVAAERDALRGRYDDEQKFLRASLAKVADHLGEAAKKPSPPATATATATSEGNARTEGSARTEHASAPSPAPVAHAIIESGAAPLCAAPPSAAPAAKPKSKGPPLRKARATPTDKRAPPPNAPECPPVTGDARPPPAASGSTEVTPALGAVTGGADEMKPASATAADPERLRNESAPRP